MYPFRLYKRFSIETTLELDEAVDLLSRRVWRRDLFRDLFSPFTQKPRGFEGNIRGSTWNINRIIRYNNSFLPMLYGKFIPASQGVRVEVIMMMHPITIAILTIVCGLAAISTIPTIQNVEQGINVGRFLLILYLVVYIIFGYEIIKAERFIRQLFEPYRVT